MSENEFKNNLPRGQGTGAGSERADMSSWIYERRWVIGTGLLLLLLLAGGGIAVGMGGINNPLADTPTGVTTSPSDNETRHSICFPDKCEYHYPDKITTCSYDICYPCSSPGSDECGTTASCVSRDEMHNDISNTDNCDGCLEHEYFCKCNKTMPGVQSTWINPDRSTTAPLDGDKYPIYDKDEDSSNPLCSNIINQGLDNIIGDKKCDVSQLNNFFTEYSDILDLKSPLYFSSHIADNYPLYPEFVEFKSTNPIEILPSNISIIGQGNNIDYSMYDDATRETTHSDLFKISCGPDNIITDNLTDDNKTWDYFCKPGFISDIVYKDNNNPPQFNTRLSSPDYQLYKSNEKNIDMNWSILNFKDDSSDELDFPNIFKCKDQNKKLIKKYNFGASPQCGVDSDYTGILLPYECKGDDDDVSLPPISMAAPGYFIKNEWQYNNEYFDEGINEYLDEDNQFIECSSPQYVAKIDQSISIKDEYNPLTYQFEYTWDGCQKIENCYEYYNYELRKTGNPIATIGGKQISCNNYSHCSSVCPAHNTCEAVKCGEVGLAHTTESAGVVFDPNITKNALDNFCCKQRTHGDIYNLNNYCESNRGSEEIKTIIDDIFTRKKETVNTEIPTILQGPPYTSPPGTQSINTPQTILDGQLFMTDDGNKSINLPLCQKTCQKYLDSVFPGEEPCDGDALGFLTNKPLISSFNSDNIIDLRDKCCVNENELNTFSMIESDHSAIASLSPESLYDNYYLNMIYSEDSLSQPLNTYTYENGKFSSNPTCHPLEYVESSPVDNFRFLSKEALNIEVNSEYNITSESFNANPFDICYDSSLEYDANNPNLNKFSCENYDTSNSCASPCIWSNDTCNSVDPLVNTRAYNLNINLGNGLDDLQPVHVQTVDKTGASSHGDYPLRSRGGMMDCASSPGILTGCDVAMAKYKIGDTFVRSDFINSVTSPWPTNKEILPEKCTQADYYDSNQKMEDHDTYDRFMMCPENKDKSSFTIIERPLLGDLGDYSYCDGISVDSPMGYVPINPPLSSEDKQLCEGKQKSDCASMGYCYWQDTCKSYERAACKKIRNAGYLNTGFPGYSKYKNGDITIGDYSNGNDNSMDLYEECNTDSNDYGGYYEPAHYDDIQLQLDDIDFDHLRSVMNCNNGNMKRGNTNSDIDRMVFDFSNISNTNLESNTTFLNFKKNGISYDTNPTSRICRPGYILKQTLPNENIFYCDKCPRSSPNKENHLRAEHDQECGFINLPDSADTPAEVDSILGREYEGADNFITGILPDQDISVCKNKYLYNEGERKCEIAQCIIPIDDPAFNSKGIIDANQTSVLRETSMTEKVRLTLPLQYDAETFVKQKSLENISPPPANPILTSLSNDPAEAGGYYYNDIFMKPDYNYYCSSDPETLMDRCYEANKAASAYTSKKFADSKPSTPPTLTGAPCENHIDITSYYLTEDECLSNNHYWFPNYDSVGWVAPGGGGYTPEQASDLASGMRATGKENGYCMGEINPRSDDFLRRLIDNDYDPSITLAAQDGSDIPNKFRNYLDQSSDRISDFLNSEVEGLSNEEAKSLYNRIQDYSNQSGEFDISDIMDDSYNFTNNGDIVVKQDQKINGNNVYRKYNKTNNTFYDKYLYLHKFSGNIYCWIYREISPTDTDTFTIEDLNKYQLSMNQIRVISDNGVIKMKEVGENGQTIRELFKEMYSPFYPIAGRVYKSPPGGYTTGPLVANNLIRLDLNMMQDSPTDITDNFFDKITDFWFLNMDPATRNKDITDIVGDDLSELYDLQLDDTDYNEWNELKSSADYDILSGHISLRNPQSIPLIPKLITLGGESDDTKIQDGAINIEDIGTIDTTEVPDSLNIPTPHIITGIDAGPSNISFWARDFDKSGIWDPSEPPIQINIDQETNTSLLVRGNIIGHDDNSLKWVDDFNECGWVAEIQSDSSPIRDEIKNSLARKCNRLFYRGNETLPNDKPEEFMDISGKDYMGDTIKSFKNNYPYYSLSKYTDSGEEFNQYVKGGYLPSFCYSQWDDSSNLLSCSYNKLDENFLDGNLKQAAEKMASPYLYGYQQFGILAGSKPVGEDGEVKTQSAGRYPETISRSQFITSPGKIFSSEWGWEDIQLDRLTTPNYKWVTGPDPPVGTNNYTINTIKAPQICPGDDQWQQGEQKKMIPLNKESNLNTINSASGLYLNSMSSPTNGNFNCISTRCFVNDIHSMDATSTGSLSQNFNSNGNGCNYTKPEYGDAPAKGDRQTAEYENEMKEILPWPIIRAQSYLACGGGIDMRETAGSLPWEKTGGSSSAWSSQKNEGPAGDIIDSLAGGELLVGDPSTPIHLKDTKLDGDPNFCYNLNIDILNAWYYSINQTDLVADVGGDPVIYPDYTSPQDLVVSKTTDNQAYKIHYFESVICAKSWGGMQGASGYRFLSDDDPGDFVLPNNWVFGNAISSFKRDAKAAWKINRINLKNNFENNLKFISPTGFCGNTNKINDSSGLYTGGNSNGVTSTYNLSEEFNELWWPLNGPNSHIIPTYLSETYADHMSQTELLSAQSWERAGPNILTEPGTLYVAPRTTPEPYLSIHGNAARQVAAADTGEGRETVAKCRVRMPAALSDQPNENSVIRKVFESPTSPEDDTELWKDIKPWITSPPTDYSADIRDFHANGPTLPNSGSSRIAGDQISTMVRARKSKNSLGGFSEFPITTDMLDSSTGIIINGGFGGGDPGDSDFKIPGNVFPAGAGQDFVDALPKPTEDWSTPLATTESVTDFVTVDEPIDFTWQMKPDNSSVDRKKTRDNWLDIEDPPSGIERSINIKKCNYDEECFGLCVNTGNYFPPWYMDQVQGNSFSNNWIMRQYTATDPPWNSLINQNVCQFDAGSNIRKIETPTSSQTAAAWAPLAGGRNLCTFEATASEWARGITCPTDPGNTNTNRELRKKCI